MPSRRALASKIANASDHDGPWPTLSVWHGTADSLVVPANADVIVDQWRDRIGLGTVEGEADRVDGHRRTTWRDAAGRAMMERIDVEGMGHGTPLATRGKTSCGQAGAHMLEAESARPPDRGLLGPDGKVALRRAARCRATGRAKARSQARPSRRSPAGDATAARHGVGAG